MCFWQTTEVFVQQKENCVRQGFKAKYSIFLFLLLIHSPHVLLQVRLSPKEKLMVIRSTIRPRADSPKAPSIYQTIEGVIVAVLKKERHHQRFEKIWLQDFPRTTMWHPADDIGKFLLCQNSIKLDREFLYTDG